MKYINEPDTLVIKSWCNNPENGAIEQARHLAKLPFAFKQICLMPDTHQGYGMPIGGVLATKNEIIPNAVGVDIGCGMLAVKTNITNLATDKLKNILDNIRKVVPVGFKKHEKRQSVGLMPSNIKDYSIIYKEYDNALISLGTLGGGNHFIEIQKDSNGFIWVMIHSGSRNLGKQVADYYNKLAIKLNSKWHTSVPKACDLAFFPLDSEEGLNYIEEMTYCVEYAYANRRLMLSRILDIFDETLSYSINKNEVINIAHNYAKIESHFGENVVVHRKGATSAKAGEIGIIPGSQGTSSYIVIGKGNPESFMSCSHGAGRKMGRNEAKKRLSLEEETNLLNSKGILHAIRGVNDLDEASGAYKDIDVVMEEQKDLVSVLHKLEPLAVIKG